MADWCPATVCAQLEDKAAVVSAVYIKNGSGGTRYFLTLSQKHLFQNTDGSAPLGTISVNVNDAKWHALRLTHAVPLQLEADMTALRSAFTLSPLPYVELLVFEQISDHDSPSNDRPNNDKSSQSQSQPHSSESFSNLLFPLACTEAKVGARVQLSATPFGLSHINLFHGYRSPGTLSLMLTNCALVDARYLDKMEGGAVLDDTTGAMIGMIAGHLTHKHKRGSFVVVVLWPALAAALPTLPCATRAVLGASTSGSSSTFKGVVCVRIKETRTLVSWGSGVLVAPDTVVTNFHVVRNKDISAIEVCVVKNVYRRVTSRVQRISRPDEHIDLVLLHLEEKLDARQFPPATMSRHRPTVGTGVRSIGFGLLLPERFGLGLTPLESLGVVSQATPHMLICSASCWNGSSGGGVFDSDTNELVGIMSSNAHDNKSGESIPDLAFVIPVASILKTESSESESKLTSRLFKLDRTNRDVVSKL